VLIISNGPNLLLSSRLGSFQIEASRGAFVLLAALCVLATMRLGLIPGAVGAALVIISLVVHEAGHLLAARLCGVRVKAIGLSVKGAYLRRKDSKRAGTELVIAICGPIASILMFLILQGDLPVFHYVAQLNLVVALSNLLPIPSTDGARIVRSLASLLTA
jgi:membrane-associated protease RseP (regulator of RpoE activity)